MSQQLRLFSNESFQPDSSESSNSLLIAQTRQLFHHQGSNAELIQLIKTAVRAINENCKEPNLK